jgi:hypothetical protein
MSAAITIHGAGIAAPGISGWPEFRAILQGGESSDPDSAVRTTSLLSPRERRRAPATVRLSFAAAEEACDAAGIKPGDCAAIFCSGMGDVEITDYMCRTLRDLPDQLSPTRFHNSVHNAAAGYWSIGTGSARDVTAISGWRDSAVAGMIEGIARAAASREPVLLVIYDDRAHGPLETWWPASKPFSAAVVMSTAAIPGGGMARLQAEPLGPGDGSTSSLPDTLAECVRDNPSARILPMLALIADPALASVDLVSEVGSGLRLRRAAE